MEQGSSDILLIDDEADRLLITGELLRSFGFSVVVAQDASRALMQLENKIGLIVLDINLAGEDGLQLMDFLKTNDPGLPIILYTGANHNDQEVMTMLKRGATTYVQKTQPIEDLVFAIREIRGNPGGPS